MYKKLKLLTLILLSLSVYFIYNKENKNNLIYITIGDSLSLGENSYGGINYGYSDYFKDYLKKENKLLVYNKSYTSKTKTITELYNDLLVDEVITIDTENYNIRRLLSDADIVSISIGLNDIILEANKEKYLTEYKEDRIIKNIIDKYKILIKEIKKYYKKEIYIIGYYENNTKYDEMLKKINKKYKKLAGEQNDIFIDTEFLSNNNKYFDNPDSYYPNNLAYKEISRKIIEEYKKKNE
ncbi:MAG: SGNH/GDSL hydrolase family protein [Bacilli bacterium]|nr:SGNH/GDSL hydrolase family protein [Bacilli bacterium]